MTERNPDLPILDELGAEFEALASVGWAAEAERHTARGHVDHGRPPARRRAAAAPSREWRLRLRRIGRRAAIALVLLCLVGGAAFAALRGGGSGGHDHTAPTPLGRAADGAWALSAYRDAGRLCTLFIPRGGELSGSCGAVPGRGRVRAASAIAGGRRYVFGIVGPGVGRITASLSAEGAADLGAARRTTSGPAQAPVDRGAAGDAGFPAGDRWFVLDLGPTGGPAPPAVITPSTRRGGRAGPPYVDCSLGIIGAACERRIEAAAANN